MATAQMQPVQPPPRHRVVVVTQSTLLVAIACIVGLTLWFRITLVPFAAFSAADFVQLMMPLLLLSLFIERSTEVFLTAARSEGAALIATEIKRLRELQKNEAPQAMSQLTTKQEEEVTYKAKTQRIAFLINFLLGTIVSALGVRAISMFVDPAALNGLPTLHARLFAAFDVMVTGTLLGGGADGLHKLVTLFTTWMDTAKASAEKRTA